MNTKIPTEQLSEYYPYMNLFEFNRFVEEQHLTQGKRFQPVINGNKWDLNPGWNSITAALITDLIVLGWNKHITKIGTLEGKGVFEIKNGTPAMYTRIKIWRDQGARMCELCGSTEDVRTEKEANQPFYSTECIECRDRSRAFEKEIRESLKH